MAVCELPISQGDQNLPPSGEVALDVLTQKDEPSAIRDILHHSTQAQGSNLVAYD